MVCHPGCPQDMLCPLRGPLTQAPWVLLDFRPGTRWLPAPLPWPGAEVLSSPQQHQPQDNSSALQHPSSINGPRVLPEPPAPGTRHSR